MTHLLQKDQTAGALLLTVAAHVGLFTLFVRDPTTAGGWVMDRLVTHEAGGLAADKVIHDAF